MSIIVISQTSIITGGKVEKVNHLRQNTRILNNGMPDNNAWADSTTDVSLDEAVQKAIAAGWQAHELPFTWTPTSGGCGRSTRIVRLVKISTKAEVETPASVEPEPELVLTSEEPIEEPKPVKKRRSKKQAA